jgi:hypothetical protein
MRQIYHDIPNFKGLTSSVFYKFATMFFKSSKLRIKYIGKRIISYTIISFYILFTACENKRQVVEIDVDELPLSIEKLHTEFKQLANSVSVDSASNELALHYGEFYKIYIESVLMLGPLGYTATSNHIELFLNDVDIQDVYNEVNKSFADLSKEEAELRTAFTRFHHFFPESNVPRIVTIISGLQQNYVITDSAIGVSLDMFLGADHVFYTQLQLPQYKRERLNRANLVPDALKAWIISEIGEEIDKEDLLGHMIREGKILYFMDEIFPKIPDYTKIWYSPEQLDWCKKNEFYMWSHIIQENLLYNANFGEIRKYISDGPFTPGFPDGSPARTASWIGWQIVRAYMNNNPHIELADLMNDKDTRGIFSLSNYKPARP